MLGGAAWNGNGFGSGEDLQAQARKLWQAWGESLRGAQDASHSTPEADWRQALQWWSQLLPQTRAGSPLGDVLDKFNAQARDWYGQMQQVAAHFAGKDAQPADVAGLWREMLGAKDNGNPFAEIFAAMHGRGPHGLDAWTEQAAAWLQALSKIAGQQASPAFGLGREYRECWQQVEKLLRDYRERNADYNALMAKAAQQAFDVFERKLGEHASVGAQIDSARALFDTWIDAAEDAYARIALSADFRHVLGELSNAQMRLRAAVQKEVEQVSELFGMPTRQEVDAAHRKIAELERALRRVTRTQAASASQRAEPSVAPAPRKAATKTVAKTAATGKKSPAKTGGRASSSPAKAGAIKKPAAKRGGHR